MRYTSHKIMKLSEELAWRGLSNQTTFESPKELDNTKMTFYFGVDPSSDSMTIGNLATAMMIRQFIRHGHKAVLLVGGATGLIGDPDGKSEEREIKPTEEIIKNTNAIKNQYQSIFDDLPFEVVDNMEWQKNVHYIDFLRNVGKHVPMRQMLGRDFVQTRLSEKGKGITYAEFSYVLIQAYDFLHLFKSKGVTLQLCGSDQWGNSIAGVDLIRRLTGKTAHVWSAPLVINKATGVKFGKSEEGAVWLDEEKTSPYAFYQFWLNVEDESVGDYFKIYTDILPSEFDELMGEFSKNPNGRLAQKTLAYSVTKLVHGKKRAESAKKVTEALFSKRVDVTLDSDDVELLRGEIKVVNATSDLAEVLVDAQLCTSKGEAHRLVKAGAISINGNKIDPSHLSSNQLELKPGFNLLKRGKNNFAIIKN